MKILNVLETGLNVYFQLFVTKLAAFRTFSQRSQHKNAHISAH